MAKRQHIPLDKITGEPTPFEFHGEDYMFAPVGPREMGQAKAKIRGGRLAAYVEMLQSLPEHLRPSQKEQRQRRNEIHRMFISDAEVAQWWLNDVEGIAWLTWKSLNKGRRIQNKDVGEDDQLPPVPLDRVEGWIRDVEGIIEIGQKILTELSGFELDEEASGEASGGE